MKPLHSILALISLLSLASGARAQSNIADGGSLLLFTEFDNRTGVSTLFSITNAFDGALEEGTIDVEFVYRGAVGMSGQPLGCLEFNRVVRLTPNDTFSTLTYVHNPNQQQGFCYAFARSKTTGKAIKFDHLIGQTLVIDGPGAFEYSLAPVTYKAGASLAQGAETDANSDGLRGLDGVEYEASADEILIPRFFGQNRQYESDLVMINLTGGTQFTALLDFLVYNDNEEVFSTQHSFRCWEKRKLLSISSVFLNDFLLTTNHNPNEIQTLPFIKTGWIRIDGNSASSTSTTLLDPAFLAVLIERVGPYKAADLPYRRGTQSNGDLLAMSVTGN